QGSGLRAQGSGLRAQGSGLRAQGSGLRAQGSGLRAQGSGLRTIRPAMPLASLWIVFFCARQTDDPPPKRIALHLCLAGPLARAMCQPCGRDQARGPWQSGLRPPATARSADTPIAIIGP
ncbi:hypothetical protein ERN12_16495, partial [Rhodobacteraceae bacterium]